MCHEFKKTKETPSKKKKKKVLIKQINVYFRTVHECWRKYENDSFFVCNYWGEKIVGFGIFFFSQDCTTFLKTLGKKSKLSFGVK